MSNLKNFEFCKNDEDRVKVVLNNFDGELEVIHKCPYVRKSLEQSEKFRKSGNLLLNSIPADLEKVLKCYAKSILYAPPGSEQLSLAYANRSAVLFRGKYYEECLEDINRALQTGYPDSLKPKLLIRKVTCNYALTGNVNFETDKTLTEIRALIGKLPDTNKTRKTVEDILNNPARITSVGKQMKDSHPMYKPEMKGENPNLPGASDAIALRYSKEYGRHLVATRDISSGEVLLIEKPYATIVEDAWIYCICSHCARRTWNGIPCDNCAHAMFCSADCKRTALKEYHDIECEILGFASATGLWANAFMGLRVTVKAIKEAGSVTFLRKRLKELDFVKVSDIDLPMNPNSYETFYIMSDYPERRQLDDLLIGTEIASRLTYFLAIKTNLFGKKLIDDLQEVKKSEDFLFVAGLMSKNIRIAPKLAYGWKVEKIDPNEDQIVTMTAVSSFLNNRCYDTAKLLRFDKDMILITYVPISKGDQIFILYHASYKDLPRDLRREVLKTGWQFDCNCSACKKNWSESTSTYWTDQNLPPKIVKKLHNVVGTIKWSDLEKPGDYTTMIAAKEKYCELVDFIYPRVKKPCTDVELLVDGINCIHMILSSMIYPRFVNKL